MKKSILLILLLLITFIGESSATTIDVFFPEGSVNYPDGTNITRQYFSQGLIFSDDPMGLDGSWISLGWQENRIQSNIFYNAFRVDFIYPAPVVSVVGSVRDSNGMTQIHSLFAFDRFGNLLDGASLADSIGGPRETFALEVSSLTPIASILFYEQNYGADYGKNGGFGAEILTHIQYTTSPVPEPTTILLLGLGLIGIAGMRRKMQR